nr:MAG TPA: antirepressor protein [Caudoviricetes sp.]
MVEFAKTAEIAQETDMLIREVREKLEAHGYDIAEKNLRILLEDKKFFAKTGKRWLLSQRMIDSGYARYRYRNDDEFYGTNTVYVTPKEFQWIVSKISKEWMPRFLELKGRVLSRSDKDIFAKR